MNDLEIINFLSSHGDFKANLTFKDITTMKIGGKIAYFVEPYDAKRLLLIIKYLKEKNIAYKIIGLGSNIVCGESDYSGCVIRLRNLNDYEFLDDDILYVEAGVTAPRLANVLASLGYSGLEFASGIPGNLGGLIYMNAGAYKKEMSEIVDEVLVLKDDELVWLKKAELEFAYRHSIFQNHPDWVIVATKIKIEKADSAEIKALILERLKRRRATQPLDKPSAGSCFRNPEGDYAWRLIDAIGFRGYHYKGIEVSEKHPNFILNVDNATSDAFISTTNLIRAKVKAEFNVDLVMEVELFNC